MIPQQEQIWKSVVLGLVLSLSPAAVAQSGSSDSQVSADNQDAEEDPGGDPKLNNDKLELGQMTWVGFRFPDVDVPQGATISSAYIEMRATDANSESTHLTIFGQNADNASSFATNSNNLSSRSRTSATVAWHNVPNWKKNKWYQTPDIAGIVQEIVNRSGWSSGNAMVILIRSDDLDGKRLVWAHDHASPQSAKLHIEYDESGGGGGGPVAHWKLDETSGLVAYDSSGNGYHGTLVNVGASPQWTSGRVGGALDFDGNDDYVEVSGLPDLLGSFTLLAWVNLDSITGDQRIFADDGENSDGCAVSIGDGGAGRVRFFDRGVSPVSLDSPALITANSWHFVAAVHDAALRVRRIYVDGTLVAEESGSYGGTWGSDAGSASLGGELDGSSESVPNWRLDGCLDDVQLYDRALSSTEIEEIHDQATPAYRLIHWTESRPD